ncbi:hypothetical protein SAMN02745116_02545 [Pilibacter termitis]|uniref:Uncharacterized protein n=1 Tax=Pilibacter termitis TaxID=263852 RepID=A0A1T4RCW9_9ENTE|nr:hypothetical protein [Pilibacter termitis]SKA13793.1 hypothetical protein SAMN02745116_02545 [Pilibacter termitis]
MMKRPEMKEIQFPMNETLKWIDETGEQVRDWILYAQSLEEENERLRSMPLEEMEKSYTQRDIVKAINEVFSDTAIIVLEEIGFCVRLDYLTEKLKKLKGAFE